MDYCFENRVCIHKSPGSASESGSLFEYLRNDRLDARNFFDRAGKSSLRQVDFVVHKRFRIREDSNVEFRAEFFNAFNLTNFANPPITLPNALGTGTNQLQPGRPYTAAAAGSFGTLSQTVERTVGLGTNRQIQFALRYNF